MKNYFRSIEESAWPIREIESKEEVANLYDHRGRAVRAFLTCGHSCILTGEAIQRTVIHCKPCWEAEKAGSN